MRKYSVPAHSCPYLQTKLFCSRMNVFLVSVQPGIGTQDLSVTDHSPVPNSCQIPHGMNYLHLHPRAVSIPRWLTMAARLPARTQLLTDDERTPERQGWGAGGYFSVDRVYLPSIISGEGHKQSQGWAAAILSRYQFHSKPRNLSTNLSDAGIQSHA